MKRQLLLVVAALGVAPPLAAEPTIWQRVTRPTARHEAKVRLRAEQLFDQSSDASDDQELLRELLRGSAALLELSGAAKRDPWQAVLLGRVLLDARPGREREAVRLIEAGVAGLPDSDFKRASLFDLGVGHMLLGDLERAESALTRALELAWDPDYRSSIYRNRSNARMMAGWLRAAVADARAAVQLARGPEVVALSHFKLGVALERSGDYPQGMQEIASGVSVRLAVPPYPTESVLDLPYLRWMPEYDGHYYRALAAMSEAKDARDDDLELVRERYTTALAEWEQYLVLAEQVKDRFVGNARRHRQRCVDALARLEQGPPRASRSGRAR